MNRDDNMAERKVIVITGASEGIGAAAARQLAAKGEQVVIVGRSLEKTAAMGKELNAPYHVADYTELAQVRRLADDLLETYPRIDVLANNAGGLFKKSRTTDGFEKTFQVNHLAGFLLTKLLINRLIESKAKIIQTSSIGAKIFGNIDLDDFTGYTKKNAMHAYGDSKLANILFTKELHRRYHSKGVSAAAFHPGNITSNFAHDYSFVQFLYHNPIVGPLTRLMRETPEHGGNRLVWFAEGEPGKDWLSGKYYEKNRIPPKRKINPQANDEQLAKELWERSEQRSKCKTTVPIP